MTISADEILEAIKNEEDTHLGYLCAENAKGLRKDEALCIELRAICRVFGALRSRLDPSYWDEDPKLPEVRS